MGMAGSSKKCKLDGPALLEGPDTERWNTLVVDSLRSLCQEDSEAFMGCLTDGSLDDAKVCC